jgi:hypothetical protein
MWMHLFTSLALAEQTVIVEDKTQLEPFASEVDPNAQILLWGDVRYYPLNFTGVEDPVQCSSLPSNVGQLQDSLTKAEDAVNYLEIEKAISYIQRIQNDMVCLNERIPSDLISSTYFLLGVAYSYNDNDELASESWSQALLFTPDLQWDENIEPSKKPKFEETKQDLQSQATSRIMLVPQTAKLSIDGTPIKHGGDIFAGSHLIQQDAVDFHGYKIVTETGKDAFIVSFADFPESLTDVMATETTRQEVLIGLRMVQPDSDFRIIEGNQMWYLPSNSPRWSVVEAQGAKQKTTKQSSSAGKKPLLYAGIGTLALGGASFALAKSAHTRFQGYTVDDYDDASAVHTLNRVSFFSGVGLTTLGSALVISGLF